MTGESNAKGGGGAEVVYGVLSAGDVSCDSDGATITLPNSIRTLCGLNLAFKFNDAEYYIIIAFPGVTNSGELYECASYYRLTGFFTNSNVGVSVSNNIVQIDGNYGGYNFLQGSYAYISE